MGHRGCFFLTSIPLLVDFGVDEIFLFATETDSGEGVLEGKNHPLGGNEFEHATKVVQWEVGSDKVTKQAHQPRLAAFDMSLEL